MAVPRTTRQRGLITSRSIRRSSRVLSRLGSAVPAGSGAAIQVFLSRLDHFVGTELFGVEEPLVIGRHRDVVLRIKEPGVSRRHVVIQLEGDQLILEDLGSANGTLVNGRRICGRVAVTAQDAVQLGSHTLRFRALLPLSSTRPSSGISEAETNVEAVLSVEGSQGSAESLVPVDGAVDRRLYEEAVRRATGAERPKNVVPLRPSPEPSTAVDEPLENYVTNRHPNALQKGDSAIGETESRTNRSVELEPVGARGIDEVNRAVDSLGLRPSEQRYPSLPITGDTRRPKNLQRGHEIDRPTSTILQVTPRQSMGRERDALEVVTSSKQDAEEVNESAVELVLPAPEPAQPRTPPVDPQIARSLLAPVGSPDVSRQTSVGTRRSYVHARLVTPSERAQPKSPLGQRPEGSNTRPERERAEVPAKPPSPAAIAAGQPEAKRPPSRALEAIKPPPLPKAKLVAIENTAESDRDGSFDGVEIAARLGDRLLDIAILRKEGDQYVLGQKTPQGAPAPHKVHPGLRLLKIGPERHVDLVFPLDVAGHLVRGGETVMLRELTEGRKYSCLRLKARDIATLILGQGADAISYHVRFLRTPREVTRAGKLA